MKFSPSDMIYEESQKFVSFQVCNWQLAYTLSYWIFSNQKQGGGRAWNVGIGYEAYQFFINSCIRLHCVVIVTLQDPTHSEKSDVSPFHHIHDNLTVTDEGRPGKYMYGCGIVLWASGYKDAPGSET